MLLFWLFAGAIAWLFSGFGWVQRLDRWSYNSRVGRFLPGSRAFREAEHADW
jgi:hypothetical protein